MMKIPRLGNYVLIAISYGLYTKYNPACALVLLGVTVITFLAALKIEKDQAFGCKKYLIWTGIILALIPLILFKYYNFISSQLSAGLALCGVSVGLPGLNWVMPLGISFYTLQAVGYLADVYLQRIKAERNWWDYMLFVCFFLKLLRDPSARLKICCHRLNHGVLSTMPKPFKA